MLSLFCLAILVKFSLENEQSRVFQVNKETLREVWYTATLRGLIKAKSRACLPLVPEIDRIIYKFCEHNAKKTIELARCATKLFDARDREKDLRPAYFRFKRYKNTYRTDQKTYRTTSSKWRSKNYNLKSELWMKIAKTENQTNMEVILTQFQAEKDPEKETIKQKRKQELLSEVAQAYETALTVKRRRRWKRKINDGREPLMDLTKKPLDYSKITAQYFSSILGKGTRSEKSNQHTNNIRRIKDYFDKTKKVKEYYSLVNRENSKLFSKMNMPFLSRDPQVPNNEADVLEHVLGIINDFAETHLTAKSKVSILSPRLFSILPDRSKTPQFLSPNMLSFHSDGFFSLPNLFQVVTSNQDYQKTMLELIMDLSGAGQALEGAISHIKPEMEELERVHYPMMQEMSRHDHHWIKARGSFSTDQEDSYRQKGYAFLDRPQMEKVYSDKKFYFGNDLNVTDISLKSIDEREKDIENYIREISQIGKVSHYPLPAWPNRFKREADSNDEILGNESILFATDTGVTEEPERGVKVGDVTYYTMTPVAFTSFVGEGITLSAITLSPQFFITELLSSQTLSVVTLSPEAMIATILAPAALVARILSPSALHAEVLSPRAFYPFILSPRALIAEVLNPRAFEPRVLSPEILIIDVLSPTFLSPNVGSGESYGLIILSPNILSPRVESEEHFLLEVLSPHILGGPHGKEDETVISIGGGEHEHEHKAGDENTSEHGADIHVHQGSLEGEHAHDGFEQPSGQEEQTSRNNR